MFETVLNWITANSFELFGTIAGLLYIYFSIKQNIWLWPVGFIASALSLIVFFQSKLYADMLLQVYYLIVSVYGYIYWHTNRKLTKNEKKGDQKSIIILNLKQILFYILLSLITTLPCWYIFKNYTDASAPLVDSFVSSASIIATWMLARKHLQNWIFWIVIDFISTFLFLYKQLYFFAGLFIIYTILAVIGYRKWKQDIKTQTV
jgi:nicotinamide mononucleotide transporter